MVTLTADQPQETVEALRVDRVGRLRCPNRCRGHEEGQGDHETTPIPAQFKAKVATEALRDRTIQAIAASTKYIRTRSAVEAASLQAGLEEVFAGATTRRQKDHEATIHDLHASANCVERDFLSRGLGR